MKKFILSFVALSIALFMCAALGACRNDGDGEDNSERHSETEKSTDTSGEETSDSEEATTEEETEDLTPKLTGENAKTIEYAERIAGGINTGYSDSSRSQYAITNRNAVFNYNLTAKDRKFVSSLENIKGGVYLENTMDVFVKTNDGNVLYASDTLSSARVNIYRLGHYYYDVHILDQDFSVVSDISDNAKEISLTRTTVNQMSRPIQNDDGSITCTVQNSADPYIVFSTARFSTEDYNAVEITLRCESSSSAQLYVAAGGNSFNPEQLTGFSVTPGDEYITYIIPISQLPNYTGNVTGLRIDIGSVAGEVIDIKSVRALNVQYDSVDITLDRNIHAYSDKMNQVLHFVTTDQVDNMTSYGMVTKISADKVDKLIVKDEENIPRLTELTSAARNMSALILRMSVFSGIFCLPTNRAVNLPLRLRTDITSLLRNIPCRRVPYMKKTRIYTWDTDFIPTGTIPLTNF